MNEKNRRLIILTVSVLSVLVSGCFLVDAIKDRYQPFVVHDDDVEGGKKRVDFYFEAASANSVHLAGEFNNWTEPDERVADAETRNIPLPMEMNEDTGFWEKSIYLSPGKYEYKYVLDGGAEWKADPNTRQVDDSHGGKNSVIVVD